MNLYFLTPPKINLDHKYEQRGFVEVPLDYTDPSSSKLMIFYRFMTAVQNNLNNDDLPCLVVVNGGPGAPSSVYRSYDYNYETPVTDVQPDDVLYHLTQFFRVLIIDQRGTAGQSAPLDLNHPDISYEAVAKYFDSSHIAKDHERVIEQVLGKSRPFCMIFQSYGGLVGVSYLTDAMIKIRPQSCVFSCSALPNANIMESYLARRQEQMNLNLSLLKYFPKITSAILNLMKTFESAQENRQNVHFLWDRLGKGNNGSWQPALMAKIEALSLASRDELSQFTSEFSGSVGILNYILSSSMFSPGQTDRTLALKMRQEIPFEEWMLDESICWSRIAESESPQIQDLLNRIDAQPPAATIYPSFEQIKKRFDGSRIMFIVGENDAYLPADPLLRHIKNFEIEGVTDVKLLPGGHKAAFLESGAKEVHMFCTKK
ncbi:MAG: alpha/beta fold hydrolase [Proteobacteria bacterium]|nr:alpha/beta fold hydrolase [Pseudomonadota bacterium]